MIHHRLPAAIQEAVEVLAKALVEHYCGACAGHDEHEQCRGPDWNQIGLDMAEALGVTVERDRWNRLKWPS